MPLYNLIKPRAKFCKIKYGEVNYYRYKRNEGKKKTLLMYSYANRWIKPGEVDNFLIKYNLPKLTLVDTEILKNFYRIEKIYIRY